MGNNPACLSYEVILFDADGTLFDFQRAERQALHEAMVRFGLAFDEAIHPEAYASVNHDLWRQLEQGRISAEQLKVERFRRYLASHGPAIEPDAFSREYLSRLSHGTFLIDGAEALLADLRTRFTLAIVTNGLAEVQRPRLARSAVGSFFSTVVVSEEVGVAKPDAGIFQHALRQLRHDDLSSVLMVGDSLAADIQGGSNAGIRTCWFNPSGAANNTAVEPTFEITALPELPALLGDVSFPSASRA